MCPSPNVDVHRSLSRRFFLQIWQAEVILKSLPLDIEFWEFLTIAGRFFLDRRSWQGLNPVDEMPRLKFPHRWARIHVITFFLDWNLRVLHGDLPTKNKLPSFMSNFNYLRVSLMILRREIIHALCNFWVSFLLGFIIHPVSSSFPGNSDISSSGAQDILMKTILGSC